MGQISGQYFEDTRKLRLIAYESAMKEWLMRAKLAFDKGETIPAFGDILLEHIEYSYVIRRYAPILLVKIMQESSWTTCWKNIINSTV